MTGFSLWHRWLVAASALLAAVGVLMALLVSTPAFDLFNQQIDPAFWSGGVVDPSARLFQHWVYGAWGATMAGWGVVAVFVAYYPFGRKEGWAWNGFVAGLLLWYGLDTALSLGYRVYFNALFNTVCLVIFAVPLAMTRGAFGEQPARVSLTEKKAEEQPPKDEPAKSEPAAITPGEATPPAPKAD